MMFGLFDRPAHSITTARWMLCLCLGAVLAGGTGCLPSAKNEAVRGVLDLRAFDFQGDGVVALDGEWEFYFGRLLAPGEGPDVAPDLVRVPGVWNHYPWAGQRELQQAGHGFATYRLRVLIPEAPARLALNIEPILTASRVYLNGREVSRMGVVARRAEEGLPFYAARVVAFDVPPVNERSAELELLIHASNYHFAEGGLKKKIFLGTENEIRGARERVLLLELCGLTAILIMGLYHVLVFLLRRRELSLLYFGLSCLCIAFYGVIARTLPWVFGDSPVGEWRCSRRNVTFK